MVLNSLKGAHNLAFDVRQNLATVSVGRREEGRQTGALQLSGSTQSGMGHPASNCLFILCQRDLHISMSLRTAREVREQSREEQGKESEAREKRWERKRPKFKVVLNLCSSVLPVCPPIEYSILTGRRQPPWRVQ